MKTKNLNKILFAAFCLSAFFFIFTIFVSNKGASSQKSFDSALVNPKYKKQVNGILIKKSGEEIYIEKKGDFFIVGRDEICSFADSKITSNLIENFCRIRKIYRINKKEYKDVYKSRQIKNKDNFPEQSVHKIRRINNDSNSIVIKNQTSLQETEKKTEIIFYDFNGNIVSDIEFSLQNALLGRIEFLSKDSVFETEDDFSQFLTTSIDYWSDGNLFPEIKNPVKITFSLFSKEEPAAAKNQGSGAKIFSASDSDSNFLKVSSAVLPLRHGILSEKDFYDNSAEIYSSLEIEDGGGRISTIFFKKAENQDHFICSKNIVPSPADSKENKAALKMQNALFELSSWTMKNIEEIFISQ